MTKLNHILVTADLRDQTSLETARTTARQAFRLATPGETRVTFLNVVQANKATREKMLLDSASRERERYLQIHEQLSELGEVEGHDGVEISTSVLFGKAWISIIEEVLKSRPDLLLAGPAHRGPVAEALFGSTTLKLIRKCPCPVWVTKPVEKEGPEEVLVAHDLTDVGYAGLEWGVELMRRDKLHLHVLHCLEPEDFFGFMSATSSEILDKEISSRRERVEQDLARLGVDESARVSIKVGPPQVEIYNYLSKHSIDLLIMGTLARSGVSAMITGNTAETLLPWVRCSLLALKPSTFVSPVPKSVSE